MRLKTAGVIAALGISMMLTGCGSFGEDMLNKIVDSDAMQDFMTSMESLESSLDGYSEAEKSQIFDSLLKQEALKAEASKQEAENEEVFNKVTNGSRPEACHNFYSFIIGLEDQTPKFLLDDVVKEKAGGMMPLDIDVYMAAMNDMTTQEWKTYFIKLDGKCKDTATAIKTLIPSVVKILQQP